MVDYCTLRNHTSESCERVTVLLLCVSQCLCASQMFIPGW
jgi:hypothetical protein